MFPLVMLGMSLWQQFDPVRASELAERALRSKSESFEREQSDREARERHEFERRFNAVAVAVDAFTRAYNSGRGHVWPRKEAEELAKAIKALERTSAWRPIVAR